MRYLCKRPCTNCRGITIWHCSISWTRQKHTAVEVVATYKLHNLNRTKLENIFHRLFGATQLDLTIEDRFGHPVKPREWFLVPLHVIDEAVQRIRDGSITDVLYDAKTARLV